MNNLQQHKTMCIRIAAIGAAAIAASLTTACAPLIVGGAMAGGMMVATDRRSPGIQIEDEAIERRVSHAIGNRFDRGTIHVNVTSYNRRVLLTGEVPTDEAKSLSEALAAKQQSVGEVVNELQVGALSGGSARSSDTGVTAKVRAAMLDAKEVPSSVIKVVTERGVVYLMGRVTEDEGKYAGVVASRVSGVRQVVKLFDYISEAEVESMRKTERTPESQRK